MSKRSPRLQFTEEELADPKLKKAIHKADKAVDKLDKAESKIPKKKVKVKERVFDEKAGTITTRLLFEEVDKKRPVSKLSHDFAAAPLTSLTVAAHREVQDFEDDNAGIESAHKLEEVAEGGARTIASAHRSQQLKSYRNADRAEAAADKANLKALNKISNAQNPQFQSNPYSRWQQKQAIKREYAAVKAGKSTSKTAKASETTAKAAKRTAESAKKTGEFILRHKKGFLIAIGISVALALLLSLISSFSVFLQAGGMAVSSTTYPSEDSDMLAAEARYCAMETELQNYIDTYESSHGYDEYHYNLDSIEHDPHVLISAITALRGGEWMIEEVDGILDSLFKRQYILTETVTTETRYRTETRTGYYTYTDPNTDEDYLIPYEYEVQIPYAYNICTVKLVNSDLSRVPVYIMSEEQLAMYTTYMEVLGNRPDLFAYPTAA